MRKKGWSGPLGRAALRETPYAPTRDLLTGGTANHQEFGRFLTLAHHDGNGCATRTRLEARVLLDEALQPAVQLLGEISHGFLNVSPPSVKCSGAEPSQAGCHMLTVYRP